MEFFELKKFKTKALLFKIRQHKGNLKGIQECIRIFDKLQNGEEIKLEDGEQELKLIKPKSRNKNLKGFSAEEIVEMMNVIEKDIENIFREIFIRLEKRLLILGT